MKGNKNGKFIGVIGNGSLISEFIGPNDTSTDVDNLQKLQMDRHIIKRKRWDNKDNNWGFVCNEVEIFNDDIKDLDELRIKIGEDDTEKIEGKQSRKNSSPNSRNSGFKKKYLTNLFGKRKSMDNILKLGNSNQQKPTKSKSEELLRRRKSTYFKKNRNKKEDGKRYSLIISPVSNKIVGRAKTSRINLNRENKIKSKTPKIKIRKVSKTKSGAKTSRTSRTSKSKFGFGVNRTNNTDNSSWNKKITFPITLHSPQFDLDEKPKIKNFGEHIQSGSCKHNKKLKFIQHKAHIERGKPKDIFFFINNNKKVMLAIP